jgi:protein arginine kinase activator
MDMCEECNKRKSELEFVEIKEGKRIVRHLCGKCAEKLAIALPAKHKVEKAAAGNQESKALEELVCPTCGLSYAEFLRTAKLGCQDCFEAFGDRLNALLRNLHDSARYSGKPYEQDDSRTGMIKQKRELKEALNRAIQEENFEEAARLRDEIKALEKDLNES